MWVFCGGTFRSASTLQFQITTRLVKDAGLGQQIGWIDAYRFGETGQRYGEERGYKVVKVHVCTELIQAEFLRHNALGIYSFRDIRDVFSSYLYETTPEVVPISLAGGLSRNLPRQLQNLDNAPQHAGFDLPGHDGTSAPRNRPDCPTFADPD